VLRHRRGHPLNGRDGIGGIGRCDDDQLDLSRWRLNWTMSAPRRPAAIMSVVLLSSRMRDG
jgi:hypothetical protein